VRPLGLFQRITGAAISKIPASVSGFCQRCSSWNRLFTLFQVISHRYEHGSIILTTNRGIADWGQIFEDTTVATAVLDRLLHHASVLSITGDSYRMRRHRDAIAALLTGRPAGGDIP
jgi:hypothetical protein